MQQDDFWGIEKAGDTRPRELDPHLSPLEGFEYAGFWIRAAARLVDTLITYAIVFAVSLAFTVAIVIGIRFLRLPLRPLLSPHYPALAFLISVLATTAYGTLAEGLHGSTPGKMVFGLMVLDEQGGFCRLVPALKRSIAVLVDAMVMALPAYASIRESPMRQRIGDKWAHTIVVRRRSLSAEQRRPVSKFLVATVVACAAHGVGAILARLA